MIGDETRRRWYDLKVHLVQGDVDAPFVDDEARERWYDLMDQAEEKWHDLTTFLDGEDDCLPCYWHEVVLQQRWSKEDLEDLMESARASSRTSLHLEPSYVEDQAAATRTMQVARSFPHLEHLALQESDIIQARDVTTDQVNWLLEAYVALQKAAGSLSPDLSSFEFSCNCSVSTPLLHEFLGLAASTLTFMQIGDFEHGLEHLDDDLAKALSVVFGRLPSLQKLQLSLPISASVHAVVQGLEAAVLLEDLYIGLYDMTNEEPLLLDFTRKTMPNTIREVASLVARSKTLRKLELANYASGVVGNQLDASQILLKATESASLETLRLVGTSARCSDSKARGKGSRTDTSISIEFERCGLGVGTFELLSRFKGIKAIEIVNCVGLPPSTKWRRLFANVQTLTMSCLDSRDRGHELTPIFHDATLKGIANASRFLERVELDLQCQFAPNNVRALPSLQIFLTKAPATVHLSLVSNDSDEFLLAGIEGTKTLKSLYLRHTMKPPMLAKLFKSIQVNSSLDTFRFDLTVFHSGQELNYESDQDAIFNLLRFNKTMTKLALNTSFCSEHYASALLPAIVNGLSFNRTMRYLEVPGGIASFSNKRVPVRLAMVEVLKKNTVLKRICDIYGRRGSDDREEIGYYLWMNRSGRHFVKNPELVTRALLPHMLSAISKETGADGVRYFLTHLPVERLTRLLSTRGIRRPRPASFDD
jgi:hypothetical protein